MSKRKNMKQPEEINAQEIVKKIEENYEPEQKLEEDTITALVTGEDSEKITIKDDKIDALDENKDGDIWRRNPLTKEEREALDRENLPEDVKAAIIKVLEEPINIVEEVRHEQELLEIEKILRESKIPVIKVKKINKSDVPYPSESDIPGYYSVYADFTSTPFGNNIHIPPGHYRLIPTNINFEVPDGYEIKITSKVGNLNMGLGILQQTDINGFFSLFACNHRQQTEIIVHGQKITEVTLVPIMKSKLEIIE
jgi:dUTPase